MKPEKQTKIHPCSLEHYDRYRLRNSSGAIIAVGSYSDMVRMRRPVVIKGKTVSDAVEGSMEFFAGASK